MIESYLKQLKANSKAENTVKTYSFVLKALNNFKPIEQITKNDLIEFFNKLNGTDETRRSYQAKIKKFFTDNEKAELVEWIKLIKPKEKLRVDDVLTADDVNKMLDSTNSDYWKAWIVIAFESGARFSEIRALKYKDFKETNEGLIVDIPTTKTASGFRRMLLVLSANYFRNLKVYTNASADDIVFPLKEPWTLTILKEIGKKAGITKHVNPHAFRHASATLMVQQGYNEAIIRTKLGWTKTSSMIGRYQHLNDNAVVEATLRNNGKIPSKIIMSEIKEAEKINLVDAGMQLTKLSEENLQLKAEISNLKEMVIVRNEDMAKTDEQYREEMDRLFSEVRQLKEVIQQTSVPTGTPTGTPVPPLSSSKIKRPPQIVALLQD
jgi:integrase